MWYLKWRNLLYNTSFIKKLKFIAVVKTFTFLYITSYFITVLSKTRQ